MYGIITEYSNCYNKKGKINVYLLSFLITDLIFSDYLFFVFNIILFVFFIKKNNKKIFKTFEMRYIYLIIGLSFFSGIFSLYIGKVVVEDFFRDIFYSTFCVFIICNGIAFNKFSRNNIIFFNTFLLFCGLCGFFWVLKFLYKAFFEINIENLNYRQYFLMFHHAPSSCCIAIILILLNNQFKILSLNKFIIFAIGFFCTFSIFISFSRHLLLSLFVFLVILYFGAFRARIIDFFFKLFSIFFLPLLFSAYIFSFFNFLPYAFSKLENSITEISLSEFKNDIEIQTNWRAYENYSALLQFNNYSLFRQMVGMGYGERIEVGEYAFRFLHIRNSDGSMSSSIPVIHNGYYLLLCKSGIIGAILFFLFIGNLFFLSLAKNRNVPRVYKLLMLVIVVLVAEESIVITGIFHKSYNHCLLYLLGFVLYSLHINKYGIECSKLFLVKGIRN